MNIPTRTTIAANQGTDYAWLRQGLNDYEMAVILQDAKKGDGACYHAQQATEKALKFLISHAGQAFRHPHSVHERAKDSNNALAVTLFNNEQIDRFKELSQYTSIVRYPSASDVPVNIITANQTQNALQTLTEALLILEQLYASY